MMVTVEMNHSLTVIHHSHQLNASLMETVFPTLGL